MTREEAKSCIGTIKMLQRLAYNIHGVMDVIDADNCKKIIKALEQEPCEDCISRQAAIDACLNGWNKDYKEIVEEIRTLPPVTPQPKMGRWIVNEWTFTSERPPEIDDEVIAYDGADAFIAWYGVNGWHSNDNRFDPRIPIIKWKPINLPKAEEKTNDSCWKEFYESKFMKKV